MFNRGIVAVSKSKPLAGAWFGRSPDHYATKGAEVRHDGTGWFAIVDRKARGPLSSLEAAMVAADKMLTESAKHPPASECAA